jgi:5'-AMP-activated protein kinase regulatory gamma subunit
MICPDIEKSLGVATPPLISEHPNASLYNAAQRLIQTHARRLPLLDDDSETGHQVVVSVLTQYRLLKFIAINVMRSPTSCPRTPPHLVTVHAGYSIPSSSSPQTRYRHLCSTRAFGGGAPARAEPVSPYCDCHHEHHRI